MQHSQAPEHATTTGIDHRKMLIWAFLGSECMFFGSLIATYLVYYGQSLPGTPTPGDVLDIPTTSVSTFVLLMSSLLKHQQGKRQELQDLDNLHRSAGGNLPGLPVL